jgi:hypothetical protein
MKLPRIEFLMLAVCAAAGLWVLAQRERQAQQPWGGGWPYAQ